MSKNNRIIQFDVIRGGCILYIVGIWHLNNYLNPVLLYSSKLVEYLGYVTTMVLATFTFISGYFLRKYEFRSWNDALTFFKKRAIRFYPLFILSSLSLYLIQFADLRQVLYCISGLALFTQTPIKTLWYISMLTSLYAITPLLRMNRIIVSMKGKLICFVFFIILLLALYFKGWIDERLVIYAPIYICGLYSKDLHYTKKVWRLLAVVSLTLMISIVMWGGITGLVLSILIAFLGVLFIVSSGHLLPSKGLEAAILFFAYVSMSVYLFHRQIFGISLFLFGIKEGNVIYMSVICALLTLIGVFAISWIIQHFYDKLILRFGKTTDNHHLI